MSSACWWYPITLLIDPFTRPVRSRPSSSIWFDTLSRPPPRAIPYLPGHGHHWTDCLTVGLRVQERASHKTCFDSLVRLTSPLRPGVACCAIPSVHCLISARPVRACAQTATACLVCVRCESVHHASPLRVGTSVCSASIARLVRTTPHHAREERRESLIAHNVVAPAHPSPLPPAPRRAAPTAI